MTVKVLVTSLGQHVIADTKQISRKDNEEVIAYWVENPRVVSYTQGDDGSVAINFLPYCMISDENAFSVKESFITSILEVREDVKRAYHKRVFGTDETAEDEVSETEFSPENVTGTAESEAEVALQN